MGKHIIRELPELSAESFYHDKNSIYIRVTYMPDHGGYRVTMYNEIVVGDNEEHTENIVKLFILSRGLAEIALDDPQLAFEYGYNVQADDAISLAEGLTDDEKDLLKNPVGNA